MSHEICDDMWYPWCYVRSVMSREICDVSLFRAEDRSLGHFGGPGGRVAGVLWPVWGDKYRQYIHSSHCRWERCWGAWTRPVGDGLVETTQWRVQYYTSGPEQVNVSHVNISYFSVLLPMFNVQGFCVLMKYLYITKWRTRVLLPTAVFILIYLYLDIYT